MQCTRVETKLPLPGKHLCMACSAQPIYIALAVGSQQVDDRDNNGAVTSLIYLSTVDCGLFSQV